MLAFVNVHNLNKTARETVSAFSRPFRALSQAASVSSVLAVPVASPEPEPVPADRSASAIVVRRLFLNDLTIAGKHGKRSPRRECILTIGRNGTDVTSIDNETMQTQIVDAAELEAAADGEPVAVCVPDSKLCEMLRKLKTDRLKIVATIDGTDGSATVRIEADGATFTLPAENADRTESRVIGKNADFTDIVDASQPVRELEKIHCGEFGATFATVVPAGELRNAILRSAFACDTDSTRYALGGILFEQTAADFLTLASTDSRRLVVRRMNAETAGTFPEESCDRKPFIVSSAALKLVSDSIDRLSDSEPVAIASAGTEFIIESDGRFSIRGRVVDGRFPRFRDVIPRNGNAVFRMNRKRWQENIETAAIVCAEESRGILLTFPAAGTGATVSGESPEFGKSSVPFTVETVSGELSEPVSISLDPKYLTDFLKTSKAENVDFQLTDAETAAVLRDAGASDGEYVIMPLSQNR